MPKNVTRWKIGKWTILLIIFMVMGPGPVFAQKLYQERIYEPVIVQGGDHLKALYNAPVTELFVYAYDGTSQAWRMIPFQIDERVLWQDPYNPEKKRHFYVVDYLDGTWETALVDTNPFFDGDDELVFMVRDLGDKAPDHIWIDNAQALSHPRLEIIIYDPANRNKKAYAYVFRSSTITDAVPAPYGLAFDPENHNIESNYYSVQFNTQLGIISDIAIKPPYGTGQDLFDTQKIRFGGLLDLGFFPIVVGRDGNPAATEAEYLHEYDDYLAYSKNPVVRVVREVRQTLRLGQFPIDEIAFYVGSKFYPFNGTLEGGVNLDPDSLKDLFGTTEEIVIEFDFIRQSWDFNQNATGMKFYNKNNDGIVIDGNPDQGVNVTINTPIQEWTLASGNQGSVFNYIEFVESYWKSVELYYYDNKNGGQGDSAIVIGDDTGDQVSYGDMGVLFRDLPKDSAVSIELGFKAYFLEKNKTKSDGANLGYWAANPAADTAIAISFPVGVSDDNPAGFPEKFALYQNYPNPFNSSTIITFSLPGKENVTLTIIDINGRTVANLVTSLLPAGVHTIHWNGLDDRNNKVASGIYFYKLAAGHFSGMKKLILVQ